MVFLITSLDGYNSFCAFADDSSPVWLSADALPEAQLEELRTSRHSVSVFNYPIPPTDYELLTDAIETIKEHHPNQPVWVQL